MVSYDSHSCLVFSFAVSTVTKGQQMVPILNSLDVQCAVYGNHDFGKCSD